jgi:hypothetical protein
VRGGGGVEFFLTDRAVPTLFEQIQWKYFLDRYIGFVSIVSIIVIFPTRMILKEDSGDEHKFCTTLMEKTVSKKGILNSNLISDQFFFQCNGLEPAPLTSVGLVNQYLHGI